ncbi:MAG TPA: hypothetical protein VKY24_13655 [Reyranella sp.]|jgi:hypothetical protein|nr:hypothetical protein [Reyranella sp.]
MLLLQGNNDLILQSRSRIRRSWQNLAVAIDCLERAIQLRAALSCLERRTFSGSSSNVLRVEEATVRE